MTVSGTAFASSLPESDLATRENLIVQAVRDGLHVQPLWVELHASHGAHSARFFVSADALRIGNAEDAIRVNVSAGGAQRIADQLGTVLPTTRLVDLIWHQAQVRLSPCTQTPDAQMASTSRMVRHSREVDDKLRARAGLISNVGKDWVLSNALAGKPTLAANYGWFRANGTPIQSLGLRHDVNHVDYSQVVRLVRRDVIVDGTVMDIEQLGRDPALAPLLSVEGALTVWRIAAVAASSPAPAPSRPTTLPSSSPVLRQGSKGAEVAIWQRQLMRDGYDLSPWNDDGDFGKVTHNATVSWQTERGLPGTGVVDAASRAAIGKPPIDRPAPTVGAIPFKAARNFTKAGRTKVDVVVIHTMEAAEASTTAENVAAWAAGPNAPQASWHYAIDDDSIVQCVKEEDVAWAAPGRNREGIQLEHAGYAKQTAEQWADPFSARMLERSALLTAAICKRWNIPVEFVDAEGLNQNTRGITTHAEVTKGPGKGLTSHTDPGKFFPMARYLELVRAAMG